MSLTTQEKRRLMARIVIGETVAARNIKNNPHSSITFDQINAEINKAYARVKTDPDNLEDGFGEIIMFVTLITLRMDRSLLGQSLTIHWLDQLFPEQAHAALHDYLTQCEKFYTENKDNEVLLKELGTF